jgi:SAM-dependent methyltransferase
MTHTALIDWYDTPRWYDMVFDPGTPTEADFVMQLAERYGRGPLRSVLEPACGSGRMVVELARRGVRVEGFDLNTHMLAAAQAKLDRLAARGHDLSTRLRVADMRAVPAGPKVDAAHCLVSTFKYILDEEGALAHLRGVAQRLKPGGIYVLGVHITDYAHPQAAVERWTTQRRGTKVVCVTRTFPAERRTRTEAVRTRLTVTRGAKTHRQETNWTFRTYSPRQLVRLVRESGCFGIAGTFDFHHDARVERELEDGRQDVVLVLKKQE